MDPTYTTAFLVIAVAGWLVYTNLAKKTYPPEPPRLPIIGNAHWMPTRSAWLVFSEWNKTYGGIIHLDVLGKSIVVINSLKIYGPLKRFSVGFSKGLGILPYGDTWRKQRHMVVQDFSPSVIPKYYALQEKEAATLVQNLLKDPDTLRDELSFRLGVIITRVTYGYYIQSPDDPMLKLGLTMIETFSQTTMPEAMRVQLDYATNTPYDWCRDSDILPGLDDEGKVLPEYAYTTGTLVIPETFSLRLRARSPQAVSLLAEASAVPHE